MNILAKKPERVPAKKVRRTRAVRARAWPEDVPDHPRILSGWSETKLRLDGSPGVAVRTVDLASIPLPGNRDQGGPFDDGLTLEQFPHWMDVARAYVAMMLREVTGHSPVDQVMNALNHVFRFLAWCVKRRIYRLSALSQQDMTDFAISLRPGGWSSTFSTESRLQSILKRTQSDQDLRGRMINSARNDYHVRADVLSRELGYVITSREFPPSFVRSIADLAGSKVRRETKRKGRGWSESSFKNCFVALNRLAHLPEALDRLSFEPFTNTREHARRAGGAPDGRTLNLPVEEAAKLLGHALKWIYDRGDGVIALVAIWRDAVLEGNRRWSTRNEITGYALQKVRAAYGELRERYDLPQTMDTLGCWKKGKLSLMDLVHELLTAVLVMVGINQARRKNEIAGEHTRPWGLYRGCLQLSDPWIEAHELDIYIEKTWRAWMRMSTSKLTVDAIRVLERLNEAIYPKSSIKPDTVPSLEEKRKIKLFIFPSHGWFLGERSEPTQYCFEDHSARFFEQAGVDERFRRTHPFRRIFALLYMYRYHHPALQALSEHLCHVDLESTRVYVTDQSMRAEAERIERVYRVRADCYPSNEIEEAQSRLADDLLREMLTSADAGGPLTRRVRKWVRRLAHRIEFAEPELDNLLQAVQTETTKRSYRPRPFRHGACWAPEKGAAIRARCGDGTRLHREHAGIDMCHACPFHSTSAAFLANIESDALELERRGAEAEDEQERNECAAQSRRLCELIALERELMRRHVLMSPPDEGSSLSVPPTFDGDPK